MGLGSVVVGVAAALSTGDYESFVESPAFSNMVLGLSVVAQLAIIAVFLPMWRRMRPGSFIARRDQAAPEGVSVVKSLAILLLVGVSAQFLVGCLLGFVEMLFPEAMAEYAELMEDTSVGVFAIVSALSIAVLAPINEEDRVPRRHARVRHARDEPRLECDRRRTLPCRFSTGVLDRQHAAGARVRCAAHESHPGELRLRARGRPGLGVSGARASFATRSSCTSR